MLTNDPQTIVVAQFGIGWRAVMSRMSCSTDEGRSSAEGVTEGPALADGES